MVNTRRLYSSEDGGKGGKGLTWITLAALAAGGYFFFGRKESRPLSDPYQQTKENIGNLQDKVSQVGSDINKKYGDDLNREVNKVGDHIKSTATLATDAAQTAYKDLKKSTKGDVDAVVDSLKDETAKITQELKAETDRFRAEHHLKEGNRPADDIVAHAHNSDIHEATRVSVTGKTLDTNEAAFDAAAKLGSELKQKAKDAANHLSGETGKFKSSITNPMVDEKRSAGRTKTLEELRLEDKAKNVVHDTSVLVEHDTDKVKDVWKSKTESNAFTYGSNLKTTDSASTSSLSSSWEDLKEDAKDAWNETKDQVSSEADHLSKKATASYNGLKHDAQDVFRNETLSAKEAWKETKDQAASEINHLKQNVSYNNLKHDAQDTFRNETLTAKEDWEDTKQKATSEVNRLKRQATDTLADVTNKTKKQAESSWTNLKENVKDDAESLLDKVEDAASNVASKYKQEASKASAQWDKAQRDANAKVGELKRNVTGEKQDNTWAGEAKNWVQENVDELKGDLKNAQEKISEGLKGTHENLRDVKPAEVVVEDAKYHNI